MKTKAFSLAIFALILPLCAGAWGSYGHQQINVAAVQLLASELPKNSGSTCLAQNQLLMQRLAITPDYDWKKLGLPMDENYVSYHRDKNAPSSSDHGKDPRFLSDKYEHPLHYFEADAFIDPSSGKFGELPTGEFQSAISSLISLRMGRNAYAKMMDPAKAVDKPVDIDIVRAHGTAPWRIRQLFQLAVARLKQNKVDDALIYLGAMGHYVGDMGQPFHTTLNFDGGKDMDGHPWDASAGIHSTFETEIFKNPKVKPDPQLFTYSGFDSTNAQVLSSAKAKFKSDIISEDIVVQEVIALISSGYEYIPSLLRALADSRDSSSSHTNKERATSRKAASSPVTVFELGVERMGASAALLARIWNSAFQAAKTEFTCGKIEFDRKKVCQIYPIPDYLPPQNRVNPPSHAAHKTDGDFNGESTPTKQDHKNVSTGEMRRFMKMPLK